MNPSQLQNEEKKHEWTIVYDRAIPPAHSVTFATAQVRKPSEGRRGVTRTLTPPACRWVEHSSASMENASEPPQSSSPVHSTKTVPTEKITEQLVAEAPGMATTSDRTNDAGPRLPQRLPVGSTMSPVKSSTKPKKSQTTSSH